MNTKNYKLYAFIAVLCCINSIYSANVNWTWNGGTSTNWSTKANWTTSDGDATIGVGDTVIITGAGTNQPALVGNVSIARLRLSGGTLTMAAFDLSVANHAFITGGTLSATTGVLSVTGNLAMSGSGVFNKTGAGAVTITLDLTIANTASFSPGTGTLTVNSDILMSGGTFTKASGNVNITTDLGISGGTFNFGSTSGTLTITNGDLSLSGGTFNLGNNSSIVNLNGDDLLISGGTLNSSGTINVSDDIDMTSGTYLGAATADLDANNEIHASSGSFTVGGTITATNTISFDGATVTLGTTLTCEDLDITGGTVAAGSGNVLVNTNLTITGGTVNAGTSEFGNSSGTNLISIANATLNATTADLNSNDITVLGGGVLNIAGNSVFLRNNAGNELLINGGTVNVSGSTLLITENLTMQSGTLDLNTFGVDVDEVYTYIGGTITDPGSFTVNNLTFSNTSAYNLSYNVLVEGALNFSGAGTGIVRTSLTSLITVDNNATTSGASASRHIAGPVRKLISGGVNSPFDFPIGNETIYAPLQISNFAQTNNGDFFTAQYDHEYAPYRHDTMQSPLTNVSAAEYWVLDRGTTSAPATTDVVVRLSYASARSGAINNTGHLRVARWDGQRWVDHGASLTGGSTTTSGSISTSSAVTNFSPFTIASTNVLSPLPVTLLSFNAVPQDKQVKVTWSTASEINNDFFTVQKCLDGQSWSVIGIVNGAENTTQVTDYSFVDRTPVNGIQYYRLIQTDINGESTISRIVAVTFNSGVPSTVVTMFPNPTSALVNVNLSSAVSGATISVFNIMGMKVMELANQSGASFTLDMKDFETGIYTIEFQHENGVSISKIIKN